MTSHVLCCLQESTRRGGPAHNNLIVAVCFSEIFNQIIT